MKQRYLVLPLVLSVLLLQGCAAGLIVAAGTAVAVTSDERSVSQQIDDNTLAGNAIDKINAMKISKKEMRINFIGNSGHLLIVGQATTQKLKDLVEKTVSDMQGVKGVYNELRVTEPIDLGQQTKDSWLTTKVKSQLTADDKVNPLKIKVVSEDNEVFLIGKLSAEMANDATNVVRKVSGVKRVNRVFQIVED